MYYDISGFSGGSIFPKINYSSLNRPLSVTRYYFELVSETPEVCFLTRRPVFPTNEFFRQVLDGSGFRISLDLPGSAVQGSVCLVL